MDNKTKSTMNETSGDIEVLKATNIKNKNRLILAHLNHSYYSDNIGLSE